MAIALCCVCCRVRALICWAISMGCSMGCIKLDIMTALPRAEVGLEASAGKSDADAG